MRNFFLLLTSVALVLGAGCHKSSDSSTGGAAAGAGKKLTIALMPKSKGNAYFISC